MIKDGCRHTPGYSRELIGGPPLVVLVDPEESVVHWYGRAMVSLMLAGGSVLVAGPGGQAAARRQGTGLVNETFRLSAADPRIRAFGAACLTGAPRGAAPPPGEHP